MKIPGRGWGLPRAGGAEAPGKGAGVGFFIEIPGRGGSPKSGGGRGAWRVSVENLKEGGGKYFFSGPKIPPSLPCSQVVGRCGLGFQKEVQMM